MKTLLEKIAVELQGVAASVVVVDIPKGNAPWKKMTLMISTTDAVEAFPGAAQQPAKLAPDGSVVSPAVPFRPPTPAQPPSFTRPLVAVIAPPGRYPAVVEFFHEDPRKTTGYRYEFDRDPNEKVWYEDGKAYTVDKKGQRIYLEKNPPTIDNKDELEKTVREILKSDEAQLILKRMSD